MANHRSIEQFEADITRALRDPEGRVLADILILQKLLLGGARKGATHNTKATGMKTVKTMIEEGGTRAAVIAAIRALPTVLDDDWLAELFVRVDEELDVRLKALEMTTAISSGPEAEEDASHITKGESLFRKRKPSMYCV